MRKTLLVLFFGIIFVSLTPRAESADYYGYSYARLSYVNGDVFIQRANDLGYEAGVVNLALIQEDKIGTREGRAEIHLGRRNYLRIDRQTQLDLIELPQRESDRIQLHLLAGDMFLRINYLEREKDIEVHTPDASFYVLEEGLYRLVISEGLQTELLVFEGQIEAAGEEGSLVVGENESLIAVDGFFSPESQYYSSYDDSFAFWNNSRDEMLSRYVARRYLPVELNEYEIELAYAGRWVYESPYGYVWVPYGIQSSWRPYYNGRWVWYPIIGWTWISHDPWGWAVYRYGRWHWRASLGWYWIPTTVWGPAWVHWYHGFDTVGWCPLSFWNRPVVIVNNIFYGQNNDTYYPAQSRALTVIHKNQLQAKSISTIALTQDRVVRMERVTLSPRQPDLRPAVDRNSPSARMASQVLSRSHLREVQRSYSSERGLNGRSTLETRTVPRSSSGAVSPGVVKRGPDERLESTAGSRPGQSSRAIRTYGSDISRAEKSRISGSGQPGVSTGKRSSSGAENGAPGKTQATRSIPRYGSSASRAVPESRSSSSRTAAPPSTGRSSSSIQGTRSSATSSRPVQTTRSSSRTSSAAGTSRTKASEKKVIKRYTPSQRSSDTQRTTVSSQSREVLQKNPKRFPSSSSSQIASRSRSSTAPARSSTSRSSSASSRPSGSSSRIINSGSSARTSAPTARRTSSSVSNRISSSRAPSRSSSSAASPARSSSSSRISSSRTTARTPTSGVRRNTTSSSSRSSSVRIPTRSSSRSGSSSIGSGSRSRTSSSSRSSSAARTSTSKAASSRVKKKSAF